MYNVATVGTIDEKGAVDVSEPALVNVEYGEAKIKCRSDFLGIHIGETGRLIAAPCPFVISLESINQARLGCK